jgi:hypothetical protein
MESLKTRQYTIKNTPIPESAKRFDGPIPWVSINMSDMRYINRRVLEAMKPMGRMDGDTATDGTFQTSEGSFTCTDPRMAIGALQRECERLREQDKQRLVMIERYRNETIATDRECAMLRGRVVELEAQLGAAQRGGTAADENEALRIIIRHLAKIL